MSAQNTLIAGGVVGALVGVTVTYLYFTDQGRSLRQQLEGNIDNLAREAEKLLGAVDQVRTGVAELRSGQQSWQQRSA